MQVKGRSQFQQEVRNPAKPKNIQFIWEIWILIEQYDIGKLDKRVTGDKLGLQLRNISYRIPFLFLYTEIKLKLTEVDGHIFYVTKVDKFQVNLRN